MHKRFGDGDLGGGFGDLGVEPAGVEGGDD